MLGSCVDADGWQGDLPGCATDIDDRPGTPATHARQEMPDDIQRGKEVRLHLAACLNVGDILDCA